MCSVATKAGSVDKQRKKILVVEDDFGLRETLKDVLGQAGYTIDLAENGQIALDKIRTGPLPDLILLDLMMPIMGGRQFLKAMKNETVKIAPIPVMIVSGEYWDRRPSDDNFVKKPCDIDVLLKLVSACLSESN
jgi:CheY-like chemotaxis protein